MNCSLCGNPFTPAAHNQKFCSVYCKNKTSKAKPKEPGKQPVKGTEKVYRIIDTLPEDYDMLGVSYDSMTLQSSLELAALPKYGLMEFEGRYYDVVTVTGLNGGLTQKLVEQETGEEILNHKMAYRASR